MPSALSLIPKRTATLAGRMLDAVRSYTVGPLSLKDPALAGLFGASQSTSSGIYVNTEMAMTVAAVFAAVDIISSDVAKVPLTLRKRNKEGGSSDLTSSNLYRLMKDAPNPDMSSYSFRKTLVAHALTCTGGFAEIERDAYGFPVALWILTPNRVQRFLEKTKLPNGRYRSRLKYRIDGNNDTVLDSSDVIDLHGLGFDGYSGYSLIEKARQAIGLALAAERFGATFFSNGSTFGGIVSTDQNVGPDLEDLLKKEIAAYNSGPDKQHRLLFLSGGWKYTTTGIAPNEAQMDELRDKQVEEVARFFNMPLHKLKLNKPGAVSYSSVEMADLDYYKGNLLNWYVNSEQEYNRKLIAPLEYKQQFFKHNVNSFMRADSAGRVALYSALLDRGVYCADDVLDLEDMNPQPNGQGKMFLVQGAMVPKDKLGEMVDASIQKKKTPPPVPPKDPAPSPVDEQNSLALTHALERLARAEAMLEEARAEARTERDARVALVATGEAKADEIARREQSELVAITKMIELEGVVARSKDDVQARQAERDAALERAARLEQEAGNLRAAVDVTGARVVELEAVTAADVVKIEALRAAAVVAAAELEELRATVVLERAAGVKLTVERDGLVVQLDERTIEASALTDRLAAAQAGLVNRTTELDAARQEWSVLNQRWLDLEGQLAASLTTQGALQADQLAAVEASERAETERLAAVQRAAEAEGAAGEARATVARCLEDVARLAQEQQSDRSAREGAERLAAEAVEARTAAEAHAVQVAEEASQAAQQAAEARLDAEAAGQAIADAQVRIESLEAAERQAGLDRQSAVEAWAAVDASRSTASAEAARLAAALTAAETERETLRQAVAHAEAGRTAAQASVAEAEAVIVERESALATERAAAEAQRVELEQRLVQQSEDVARLDRERQEAEVTRDATADRLAAAEEARATAVNESATALAEAEVRRSGLERQLAEQVEIVATRERELGEVSGAREATVLELRTAEESRSVVQAESVASLATAAERQADLARQIAERDAVIAEMERQRQRDEAAAADARVDRLVEADTERIRLTALHVEAERRAAVLEAGRLELERQVEDRNRELAETQRQLAEVRAADERGMAAEIRAHHGTIVYKMKGLVEFETDRLRRAQVTPEKLRTVIDTFYDGFTERITRSLVPEFVVHLAFIRSDIDAQAETRRYAEGHVRESLRQLESVLDSDGEPDAYAGSVTALWHRWETERVNVIADALFQEEIDYSIRVRR